MIRLAWCYCQAALRARDLQAILFASCVLVVATNVWFGAPFGPSGALGTVLLDKDGALTYGLGGALLCGAVAAAAASELDDALHVAGVTWRERWIGQLLCGAAFGAVVKIIVVLAQLGSGAADGLIRRQTLMLDAAVPLHASSLLDTQLRLLVLYVLAGGLGAAAGAVVRKRLGVIVLVGASVAPFAPAMLGVFERAPTALAGLVGLPLGALRGAYSGEAGILGAGSGGSRSISPFIAAASGVLWFAAAALLYAGRCYGLGGRIRTPRAFRVATSAAIGLTVAIVGGIVLPGVLAGSVPWQWQPDWRSASARGWASNQVVSRWISAVRAEDYVVARALAVKGGPRATSSQFQGLRHASSVRIQPVSAMRAPGDVSVLAVFKPPLETGNVTIRSALYRFFLREKNGRYLLVAAQTPAPIEARVER